MNFGTIDLHDIELPVTLRSTQPASDDLLLRLSEQHRPCKVERNRHGEITIMTPVGGIGSTHEAHVFGALYQWNEARQNGIAFGSNAGFNLPDGSCLSPDAAWLSQIRWDSLTHSQQEGYPPLCPEFIIEIRSRTDPRRMLEEKMALWIENGAQLAWLLDPKESEAVIYRPGQHAEFIRRPDLLTGNGPVEGFALRATRIWTPLS